MKTTQSLVLILSILLALTVCVQADFLSSDQILSMLLTGASHTNIANAMTTFPAPNPTASSCTDGQRQCNGMTSQVCSGGIWTDGPRCATGCIMGKCENNAVVTSPAASPKPASGNSTNYTNVSCYDNSVHYPHLNLTSGQICQDDCVALLGPNSHCTPNCVCMNVTTTNQTNSTGNSTNQTFFCSKGPNSGTCTISNSQVTIGLQIPGESSTPSSILDIGGSRIFPDGTIVSVVSVTQTVSPCTLGGTCTLSNQQIVFKITLPDGTSSNWIATAGDSKVLPDGVKLTISGVHQLVGVCTGSPGNICINDCASGYACTSNCTCVKNTTGNQTGNTTTNQTVSCSSGLGVKSGQICKDDCATSSKYGSNYTCSSNCTCVKKVVAPINYTCGNSSSAGIGFPGNQCSGTCPSGQSCAPLFRTSVISPCACQPAVSKLYYCSGPKPLNGLGYYDYCSDDCAKLGPNFICNPSSCTCLNTKPVQNTTIYCSKGTGIVPIGIGGAISGGVVGGAAGTVAPGGLIGAAIPAVICKDDCVSALGSNYSCSPACTCVKKNATANQTNSTGNSTNYTYCSSGIKPAPGGLCINNCAAGYACSASCTCVKNTTGNQTGNTTTNLTIACSSNPAVVLKPNMICQDDCVRTLGSNYFCASNCNCIKTNTTGNQGNTTGNQTNYTYCSSGIKPMLGGTCINNCASGYSCTSNCTCVKNATGNSSNTTNSTYTLCASHNSSSPPPPPGLCQDNCAAAHGNNTLWVCQSDCTCIHLSPAPPAAIVAPTITDLYPPAQTGIFANPAGQTTPAAPSTASANANLPASILAADCKTQISYAIATGTQPPNCKA